MARARRDDVTVLRGECEPRSSLPFWQHMGFRIWENPYERYKLLVRYVVEKRHQLPKAVARVSVSISFYPEDVLRGRECSPVVVYNDLQSARLTCGSVLLPRRIIQPKLPFSFGDVAIEVKLEKQTICLAKAKHETAKEIGVPFDQEGDAFFIDGVRHAASATPEN